MNTTYKELQTAATRAMRAGNYRLADDLETELHQRRYAARDRWADEAATQAQQKSDRRKYGTFYGRSQ